MEWVAQGVLVFITKKTMVEMLYLPQSDITKILAKLAKEKRRKNRKRGRLPSTKNRSIKHLV
jgi:uncharacterized protein YlbG (UPF0298 family)